MSETPETVSMDVGTQFGAFGCLAEGTQAYTLFVGLRWSGPLHVVGRSFASTLSCWLLTAHPNTPSQRGRSAEPKPGTLQSLRFPLAVRGRSIGSRCRQRL